MCNLHRQLKYPFTRTLITIQNGYGNNSEAAVADFLRDVNEQWQPASRQHIQMSLLNYQHCIPHASGNRLHNNLRRDIRSWWNYYQGTADQKPAHHDFMRDILPAQNLNKGRTWFSVAEWKVDPILCFNSQPIIDDIQSEYQSKGT